MTNPTPSAEERANRIKRGVASNQEAEEYVGYAERAYRFHLEVLGTLAELGITTPLEGYLKPGSPSVGSAIKGVARQAEQAARADERPKTLEEATQAIVALRRTRYHYGDWSVYKREACDEALKVLRALANQPSEPGEAA